MSGKERRRLVLMAAVKEGSLSVAEPGRVMGVSYRQAKRIWQRFRKRGDAGLVHRRRGQRGPRAKTAEFRGRVLARVQERYDDFGPTLAAEKLAEEGLAIDHETLRRWMGGGTLEGWPEAAEASRLARTQGVFRPDGAVGWIAP